MGSSSTPSPPSSPKQRRRPRATPRLPRRLEALAGILLDAGECFPSPIHSPIALGCEAKNSPKAQSPLLTQSFEILMHVWFSYQSELLRLPGTSGIKPHPKQ